jgi:putative salt-induced outer membrane protein YdiY
MNVASALDKHGLRLLSARLHWLTAFAFLVAGHCLATDNPVLLQKLELPNGEVLIGTLKSEDDAVYVFVSQSLGEVRVLKKNAHLAPAAHAKAEMAEQPPIWAQASKAPGATASSDAPKSETPPPAAPTPAKSSTASASPVPAKAVVPPAPPVKWKRSFEAGYSYQASGDLVSQTSTYIRAEIVSEMPTGLIDILARYLYGSQNAVRNTDKLDSGIKLHYNFADRVLIRNDFTYSYDHLKQLSNEFEENAGLSFILIDHHGFKYSVGPGVAVQYAEDALNQNGYKVLGDISQDLSWKLSSRVTLSNTASYLYKPGYWADYRLRAYSVLTGKITEQTTVNLRYEYEFEALRSVANGRSDHRVFTTLGYTF